MKILGDSAYSDMNDDVLISIQGLGRGLSSLRQTIEWNYALVKNTWKYLDAKECMKIYKQPLCKIILTCLLLQNAFICLNGSQTSSYFNFPPPSLEEWTEQGMKAHPIDVIIQQMMEEL